MSPEHTFAPPADLPTEGQAWLTALDAALAPMGPDDRREIVRELTGHLLERAAQNTLTSTLQSLGTADMFAKSYLDENDLSVAVTKASPRLLLTSLFAVGVRRTDAFLTGMVGLFLYLIAAGFAVVAALKPLLPQQVGMWKDGNGYSFGAIFGKIHTSPEMLGMWIIPISGLAAALAYFAATELMRQSGRLILSRRTIDLPR